jgi:hypothetical protein
LAKDVATPFSGIRGWRGRHERMFALCGRRATAADSLMLNCANGRGVLDRHRRCRGVEGQPGPSVTGLTGAHYPPCESARAASASSNPTWTPSPRAPGKTRPALPRSPTPRSSTRYGRWHKHLPDSLTQSNAPASMGPADGQRHQTHRRLRARHADPPRRGRGLPPLIHVGGERRANATSPRGAHSTR